MIPLQNLWSSLTKRQTSDYHLTFDIKVVKFGESGESLEHNTNATFVILALLAFPEVNCSCRKLSLTLYSIRAR